MNKEIPQKVKAAASYLIEMYGDNIKFVGTYQESDVYEFLFPVETETGYPIVFLYNDAGEVQKITGFKTFKILRTAEGLDNE